VLESTENNDNSDNVPNAEYVISVQISPKSSEIKYNILDTSSTGSKDANFYGRPTVQVCNNAVRPTFDKIHIPKQCEVCDATVEVFWCNLCHSTMCSTCWKTLLPHRKHCTGHQMTDIRNHDILNCILHSRPDSAEDIVQLANYSSKLFDIKLDCPRDVGVVLKTTNQYHELLLAANAEHIQYAFLISFVGETGSGRSLLINACCCLFIHTGFTLARV